MESGLNWIELDWTGFNLPRLTKVLKHTGWLCCTADDRQQHWSLWLVVFHTRGLSEPWTPRGDPLQISSTTKDGPGDGGAKCFLWQATVLQELVGVAWLDKKLSHLCKHLGGFWFKGFVFGRLMLWETANVDRVNMGRKKSNGTKWGPEGSRDSRSPRTGLESRLAWLSAGCCLSGKNKIILASVNLQWQKTNKGFWVSFFYICDWMLV